jgi:hypothetical protein
MTSSRTCGSIYRILFISHLFWRRPDPPVSSTTGRDLPQRTVGARHGHRTNAALVAWFGESEEPKRPFSVRFACRHGRMSTDIERPRPKIVPRRQVARP